ncbi:MAG: hypothetical protein WCO04_15440 [Pseudomonadota bacterium]
MVELLGDRSGPRYERPQRLDFWVKKHEVFKLWFEFLAISPSYHLAHMEHTAQFPAESPPRLPNEFGLVRAVYANLGDVQNTLFSTWFDTNAIRYFGKPGEAPQVRSFGVFGQPNDNLDRYEELAWDLLDRSQRNAPEPVRLISVPVSLKKTVVLNQVKEVLEKAKPVVFQGPIIVPTYVLEGDRHRIASIRKFLELVKFRAMYSDEPAWKVALRFGIGDKYKRFFGPIETARPTSENLDARNTLNVIMARALSKARHLAENAARGHFPINTKCPHALELDYAWIKQNDAKRKLRMEDETRRIKIATEDWRIRPMHFLTREWLEFEIQLSDAIGHCKL